MRILSPADRLDLMAAGVLLMLFVGILMMVRWHSHDHQPSPQTYNNEQQDNNDNNTDDDAVALTIFVIWMITTVFSCVLFDFEYLLRLGRVLTMVWIGLAIYFTILQDLNSLWLSAMGIVTGIAMINLALCTSTEEARLLASLSSSEPSLTAATYRHDHHPPGQAQDDHWYELAIAKNKQHDTMDMTEQDEDYDESEGEGDVI